MPLLQALQAQQEQRRHKWLDVAVPLVCIVCGVLDMFLNKQEPSDDPFREPDGLSIGWVLAKGPSMSYKKSFKKSWSWHSKQ